MTVYKTPNPEQEALSQLQKRLQEKTDCERYRNGVSSVDYQPPLDCGYTVLPALPGLWGQPLNDLVLAYIHVLRPSRVRVVSGAITCDCVPWRVTIFVDGDDRVRRIEQEVNIGYGCGQDINECLKAQQAQRTAQTPFVTVDIQQ